MIIKVRSVRDSFRRAGLAFTKSPVEIEVSQETFEVLKAEPMLVVEIVNEPKGLKPETGAASGSAAKTGKGE